MIELNVWHTFSALFEHNVSTDYIIYTECIKEDHFIDAKPVKFYLCGKR